MAAQRGRNTEKVKVFSAGNAAKKARDERHGMRRQSRRVLILGGILLLVVLLTLVLPTYIFAGNIYGTYTFSMFVGDVTGNFTALLGVFTGSPWLGEGRFMTVVCALVSGAALGLCGSTYQGAFNNKLAAPKTLGVMAGGALGACIWVLWRGSLGIETPTMPNSQDITTSKLAEFNQWVAIHDSTGSFIGNYGEALASVVGCFIVVGLVMLVVSLAGRGRLSNIIVIVVGQVVAGAVTGLISFLRYYYGQSGGDAMVEELREIENYVCLDSFTYNDLLVVVLPIVVCMAAVILMRNRLTLLSFGDAEAQSMGVSVNRTRYVMIILCTFMTAWSISFCGHVAFLGFISAHIARKIVGPDFRFLLPASALVGGSLLLVIQWVCHSGLPFTSVYASGTACSIIGGFLFLFLALREGRRAVSSGE